MCRFSVQKRGGMRQCCCYSALSVEVSSVEPWGLLDRRFPWKLLLPQAHPGTAAAVGLQNWYFQGTSPAPSPCLPVANISFDSPFVHLFQYLYMLSFQSPWFVKAFQAEAQYQPVALP